MSESTADLLVRGTAAARVGEEKEARFFLEWMLSLEADLEQKIEAWYWLSRISKDPKEKRNFLEEILANQPFHLLARRELMILDGKLDPNEIIDPNQEAQQPATNGERKPKIKSFTCPNCGGRMVYTPDGTALTCEYCESRRKRDLNTRGTKLAEQDFLLSMATLGSHTQPSDSLAIECTACGIQFILPPATLSFTCPHCNTNYVVNESTTKYAITPGGIVPARVSRDAASALIDKWIDENDLTENIKDVSLKGIYLPVWWFSFGGQINYKYYVDNNDSHKRSQRELIQNSRPVLRQDVMVPALSRYQQQLSWQITRVNPENITSYAPDYLSDWAAETYQKSVADASLEARQIAFSMEKRSIRLFIPGNAVDVSYDSHELMIDSYKLVLLPAWICELVGENGNIHIFVNADNGELMPQTTNGKSRSWWKKLFNFE